MQGTLALDNGKFSLPFVPAALHKISQTYATTNNASGKAELSSIVHVTFFSKETLPTPHHAFTRLIVRGNTVHYTR